MDELTDKQRQTRESLRVIGMLVTAVGGILTLIGLGSFFSAFNSFGTPDKFWCAFVGMPMIGVGTSLLRYGYLGAVTRYTASEIAPVAKDTINYLADGSQDALQTIGKAVGAGLAASTGQPKATLVRCHKCNGENNSDSKYCSQCGTALIKSKQCSHCGELNDPDARFCDECGSAFSQ